MGATHPPWTFRSLVLTLTAFCLVEYFVARLSAPRPNESLPDAHSEDPTTLVGGSTYARFPNFNPELDLEDDDSPVDVVVVENEGFRCYKPILFPQSEGDTPASSGTAHHDSNSSGNGNHSNSEGRYPSRKRADSVKTMNTDLEMNDFTLPGSSHKPGERRATRRERCLRYLGWDHVRKFSTLSAEEKHLEAEYWKERWFVLPFDKLHHWLFTNANLA